MKHISPYLSAQALGITEAEREALIWVYRGLKSGAIPAEQYDQGSEYRIVDCKTFACIGGWMAIHMGREGRDEILNYTSRYMEMKRQTTLGELFWGRTGSETPLQSGIQACLNTLTLGDPCWDELP